MYHDLILNASLLVALTALYNLLAQVGKDSKVWIKILAGLLFGGVAVAGMDMPFHYAPGIIYDGRSIVLAMAGLFGGGTVAVVSILVAGAYRVALGGNGMWAGLATILSCAMLGLSFRHACGNHPGKLGISALYALGISVHITMLACQLLVIPWPSGLTAISKVWLPVMLIFPVATVLMGVLLRNEDRRRQAEETLLESEEKFKHIFEYSNVGKSITQISGEIRINRTFCEMLGYSPQELQEKRWEEITHPDDIELTQREIDSLLSGEKDAVRFNKRFLKKDGSVIWVDLSSSLRRDEAGKPLYLMTALVDITERKRVEEALLESEEKFRLLAEASPFGIYAYRKKFFYVNPAFESLTGYTVAELLDMNFWELVHPDFRNLVRQRGTARLQGEKVPDHYEIKIVRKDGDERWIDAAATMVQLDREPTGIGIFADTTARKQAEDKIIKLNAELEQRVEERTRD